MKQQRRIQTSLDLQRQLFISHSHYLRPIILLLPYDCPNTQISLLLDVSDVIYSLPRQPCRPKAPRTISRSISLALFHPLVVKNGLCCSRAIQRLHGYVIPISTACELYSYKLEPCNRLSISTPVVRNVHCGAGHVELGVNGCREYQRLCSIFVSLKLQLTCSACYLYVSRLCQR